MRTANTRSTTRRLPIPAVGSDVIELLVHIVRSHREIEAASTITTSRGKEQDRPSTIDRTARAIRSPSFRTGMITLIGIAEVRHLNGMSPKRPPWDGARRYQVSPPQVPSGWSALHPRDHDSSRGAYATPPERPTTPMRENPPPARWFCPPIHHLRTRQPPECRGLRHPGRCFPWTASPEASRSVRLGPNLWKPRQAAPRRERPP